jgi:hypothetical protein
MFEIEGRCYLVLGEEGYLIELRFTREPDETLTYIGYPPGR